MKRALAATVLAAAVLAATVLATALGGCGAVVQAPAPPPSAAGFTEFYADATVTGEVSAPAVLAAGDGTATLQLPLRLRLHNHGHRAMELTESTRCTVLRWSIADAQGNPLEAMPNRPCPRQLATNTLPPTQTTARAYQIPITLRRGSYILKFSFWGYPGEHAFEVR